MSLHKVRKVMMTSQFLIIILSVFLFFDLVFVILLFKRKHNVKFSEDDNDFIKYNIDKALAEIQKEYINGIKMFWNTMDFILNRKKYEGTLDEKMEKAKNQFLNYLELKAIRDWSVDLNSESRIEAVQVEHFVKVIKREIENLGARF